ncbi:MAG: DsrE/DsrF/DrsH-like family protein [Halanaerobium sp.]|nr:DsrE/DsrF/DrsH-like family protein [Halanaerobium sp.]
MGKKVLIVGGVAGGASTAARLRRMDEEVEIIIFERGEYISFANCGLPYYIGDVIQERDKLLVQTPDKMGQRFNLDIRTRNEVLAIDRDKKEVLVRDLRKGEDYHEDYDHLILSPGASPLVPDLPGIEREGIFTLRSIPDTDAIKGFLEEEKPRHAVVVGGGFIGLEMVENLAEQGLDVTLVEMADQVMPPLDFEMAAFIQEHLRDNGIDLLLGQKVVGFPEIDGLSGKDNALNEQKNKKGTRLVVELESGETIFTDMVIMAIGVKPENRLAADAGLELGPRGSILVDEQLKTTDPAIYAIGDAASGKEIISGEQTHIPLAGPANKQGRLVADIITGEEQEYNGHQGTCIAKVFDMVAAGTGLNEKQLQDRGIEHLVSYTDTNSHAGYYPGAAPLTIKLLFSPEGRVLGAQVVGTDGVDKRIDVLATAIRLGADVFDLQKLELAYAPPYSSAKDPVNMAGFTAGNILEGRMEVVHWHQLDCLEGDHLILDVREEIERQLGFIPHSRHIPLDRLRDNLSSLPQDKTIIVYCQVGLRAYIAARILTQHGLQAVNLSGGYKLYKRAVEEKKLSCSPPCEQWQYSMASSSLDIEGEDRLPGDGTVNLKGDKEGGEMMILDACGLQCPGPIMQVYKKFQAMEEGEKLKVFATDPGFSGDIAAWCQSTGNTLLDRGLEGDNYYAILAKGSTGSTGGNRQSTAKAGMAGKKKQTMVVFSGDLDKAIASFIIANGAAAMGKDVTMFFTFWGLNILRKANRVGVKKGFLEKMFGWMMPRGSKKLGLSKMNMLGMGSKMIRYIMDEKNVDSLESLIEQARENGVKMVACQMSMEVMGIKREELIAGVETGGVASYLSEAETAGNNLFI